ncbi:hypothetical protein C7449_11118 [Mycoplana dimorpha]|uniref:Uncharacterized protein n=1 Tax=Mycoplana dimorpha TaxID=28320 RepID=A0A2T5AQV8_MYCDI|nr:hypothetical protein C7449_11118 [Mycoplana dimorpha]
MARRLVVPTPFESASPSWNWRSGWWQLAQEILPLLLMRASKNSALPSAAASGSSATRLDGSAGKGGRLSKESEAINRTSSAVQSVAWLEVEKLAMARASPATPAMDAAINLALRMTIPQSTRLKTNSSCPATPSTSTFMVHQPGMLNFMPSTR